jgi:hypothetical protein
MNRVVPDQNGREWVVRAQMEWRPPATADDFEQDVSANYTPGVVMLIITAILAFILLMWMPEGVVVPAWVPLGLLLIVLFFPLRWVLRRPWTVVAETIGDPSAEEPGERWVGTVRGMFKVRNKVRLISKSIQQRNQPDHEGILNPVL